MTRRHTHGIHPVRLAGTLDLRLRRIIYPPEKILGPWVRPGMTVVDFGCGPGFFARPAAELVGPDGVVVGVDIQQGMLDLLRSKSASDPAAPRIRTHLCAPDRLGLDAKADLVYSFYVLHEVPDRARVIRELCGLLKPGGLLFLMDFVITMTKEEFAEMEQDAQAAGFRPVARPKHFLSRGVVLTAPDGGRP